MYYMQDGRDSWRLGADESRPMIVDVWLPSMAVHAVPSFPSSAIMGGES